MRFLEFPPLVYVRPFVDVGIGSVEGVAVDPFGPCDSLLTARVRWMNAAIWGAVFTRCYIVVNHCNTYKL